MSTDISNQSEFCVRVASGLATGDKVPVHLTWDLQQARWHRTLGG